MDLLAREHGQPAAELAEVIAAGQQPVMHEGRSPLFVGDRLEGSAIGKESFAMVEVVAGVRPGSGDRLAQQENELDVGKQPADKANLSHRQQAIGGRRLTLDAPMLAGRAKWSRYQFRSKNLPNELKYLTSLRSGTNSCG